MASLILGSLPISSQSLALSSRISFSQSETLGKSLPNYSASLLISATTPPLPSVYCGRGDKKTAKGKRFNHSFGNARPRDKNKGRGPPRVPVPLSPPKKDRFQDDEIVKIEIDESLFSNSEITEEKVEDAPCILATEAHKERIRRIIEYQKSLYWSSSSSSSLSSAAASCSSFSSSRKSSSLLELMKGGSTSLRRLFDMEHTSLATHFDDYSGSPIIKPIYLWGSDIEEEEFQDPWASIKQIGPTNDPGTDAESKFALDGSFKDGELGLQNRKARRSTRKLTRKKSFRRLPGFGLWRCRGFRFRLRLRRLRIMICGRKF